MLIQPVTKQTTWSLYE